MSIELINNATIKIRRDTSGNWTSNDPTPEQGEWCLETDTGNVKVGDGMTAWSSLPYYIPAKLATTYDLTSADKTHTLPAITGAPQKESIYWTNGGTYTLTMATPDSATIGGETAGTWKGEGEGHIIVESDGSNWQVIDYIDSGSNSNGKWEKHINKELICWLPLSAELTTTKSDTGGYYAEEGRTFPKVFNTIYGVNAGGGGTAGVVIPTTWPSSWTTTGCTLVLVSQNNTTKGKVNGMAIGTWK